MATCHDSLVSWWQNIAGFQTPSRRVNIQGSLTVTSHIDMECFIVILT